jgi:hypothetical protein
MPRLLPSLSIAALALPCAAQENLRVEGLQGRVETLSSAEQIELLTGLGPRECTGPGHLEAGSMAAARLSWPGRASLQTQGRAGLEWRDGHEATLRVFELQHGELEVRRGPLLVLLPWNWNASFEPGAYRLRSLPGGALEIETVAGHTPRLWWERGGLLRLFDGPASGEHCVLPPDWNAVVHAERESYRAWGTVSWPWGEPPTELHVSVEPVAQTAPAPEPAPAPVAQPQAPPLPPFDAALWHGIAREELQLAGNFACERREDLALEPMQHSGFSLRLRSDATRSAWVLRAGSDLELAPGTLVTLDEQGTLLANLGSIKIQRAPKDRPAPAQAGIAPRP